ncbi:hypothetical protein ECC02_009995 [Trypanosoma cruzi]|uniref:Uncharacterized protein n=1 Tax=Trypanosoma cruzi TaxID=5693 RepID=A0A7J6XRQ6_TRYCR|nr:hypothetical protein ECC02_009995 [Trypanosoma cruzi]
MKFGGLWRRKSGRAVLCRLTAKTAFGSTSIRWRRSERGNRTRRVPRRGCGRRCSSWSKNSAYGRAPLRRGNSSSRWFNLTGRGGERPSCGSGILLRRCRQRRQWIHQIKEMNAKVLEQVRLLAEERKKKREQATAKEDVAERALAAEIKMIEEYLPKLISLEDIPVNPEETDIIRRQFDEVFTQEEQTYLASAEEERARKERLGRGLEVYRQRMLDDYVGKENGKLHDAETTERHLSSVVDQVLN